MGIYDRDYYRNEGPSYIGSFFDRGKVCKWLIFVNVACFAVQLVTMHFPGQEQSAWFTKLFDLKVGEVLHGEVWRLLTHAFLHDPDRSAMFMHILFNMAFLWWFGSDVEDLYGPREFLAIYLTAAVISGVAYSLSVVAGIQPVNEEKGFGALGASGAVTAILVICAMHYPRRLVYVFFMLPVPIWLFVALSVAQDLFGLLGGGHGNVGYAGHLGGAAFGMLYYTMNIRLLNYLPSFGSWRRQRARARLRIYREEEEPRTPVHAVQGPALARDVDEQLEARMDDVLQKVSDHGMDSLTDQEREILQRASERMKRKRK
jgi:membrane associated rhomboid family serine protease